MVCVPLLSFSSHLLVSPGHYYSGGLVLAPAPLELSSSEAAAGAAYPNAPYGSHPHTPSAGWKHNTRILFRSSFMMILTQTMIGVSVGTPSMLLLTHTSVAR